MCGIVGILSKNFNGLIQKDIDVFEQLLWVDQVRGTDGAGLVFNTNSGASVLRNPGTAEDLFYMKNYKKTIEKAIKEGNFILGHNRAATKGKVGLENTHPFIAGHIVGVHNGTLTEHKGTLADVDSDSKAIYMHMEQHGYKETIKKIQGAFALAWYDCNDKTLNFSRNFERPLHLLEYTTCWIISSEEGLGKWIAERNFLSLVKSIPLVPKKVYKISMEEKSVLVEEDVEIYTPPQTNKESWENYTYKYRHKQDKSTKETSFDAKRYHAFGTTIYFNPAKTSQGGRSLFFDEKRSAWFLLGVETGEKNSFAKVYGGVEWLQALEENEILQGVVVSTHINGDRVTYNISCAQKFESPPGNIIQLEDKRPKDQWGQGKVECAFCLSVIKKEEGHLCNTGNESEWLCPDCWTRFYGASANIQ